MVIVSSSFYSHGLKKKFFTIHCFAIVFIKSYACFASILTFSSKILNIQIFYLKHSSPFRLYVPAKKGLCTFVCVCLLNICTCLFTLHCVRKILISMIDCPTCHTNFIKDARNWIRMFGRFENRPHVRLRRFWHGIRS